MAKPNYSFEKRQRDIQKQQKKAEKLAKKAAAKEGVLTEGEAVDTGADSGTDQAECSAGTAS
jgi:hypothetical protein